MENIDEMAYYTSTHEWIRKDEEGKLWVGITFHAQSLLGDVVYLQLPRLNQIYQEGQGCGVIESVKTAADIYMPLSGQIIAVNDTLSTHPEWVNQAPYGEGWLFQFLPENQPDIDKLLSPEQYCQLSQGQ